MNRFKNLICSTVALILLVQPFFVLSTAQAQSLPGATRDANWFLVWKDGEYILKHKDMNTTAEKYYELTQVGGQGQLHNFKGSFQHVEGADTVLYMVKSLQPKYYVLMTKSMQATPAIYGICVNRAANTPPSGMRQYELEYSREHIAFWLPDTVEKQQLSCISAKFWGEEGESYVNGSNAPSVPAETMAFLKSAWRSIYKNPTHEAVIKKGRTSQTPLPANQEICKDKAAKPIFFGNANARAEFDKGIEELKKKLVEDSGNQGNESYIAKYFNNANNVNNLFTFISGIDESLFKQFYGDPAKTYPTVPPSDGKYQEILTLYQELQQSLPQDDREIWNNNFSSTILMAGVGAATIAAVVATGGVAAPAIVASIGVVGTGGAIGSMAASGSINARISQFLNERTLRLDTIKKLDKYMVASGYLMANESYNECLAGKNDPYAMPNVQLAQVLKNLTGSATDILSGVDQRSNDVCDEAFSGWNGKALMNKAFCNLLLMLKEFGDWLYKNAKEWLSISLGVAENKSLTVPEDSPTPSSDEASDAAVIPNTPVSLANGGKIKINDSTILSAIKTQASSSSGKINAAIIPTKTDDQPGQTMPASIVVSSSSNDSITVNLLSQTDLASADMTNYPKFQVQFVAGGKGYKFWVLKNSNIFTVTGTEGSQIQPMNTLPTIPNSQQSGGWILDSGPDDIWGQTLDPNEESSPARGFRDNKYSGTYDIALVKWHPIRSEAERQEAYSLNPANHPSASIRCRFNGPKTVSCGQPSSRSSEVELHLLKGKGFEDGIVKAPDYWAVNLRAILPGYTDQDKGYWMIRKVK